jgi:superfamily II DNA/RNA helicase
VIVVSDALMRGIDMPGVGAVVMYEPPTTLQQYIHRVGRTARAGAPGASYVLLSKTGPSGTEADGQVAHFKSFDSMLLRHGGGGRVHNQVKLRELPEEEVQRADEMLAKTQQRLNSLGFFVSSAAAAEQQQQQQQASKAATSAGGAQRRGRK